MGFVVSYRFASYKIKQKKYKSTVKILRVKSEHGQYILKLDQDILSIQMSSEGLTEGSGHFNTLQIVDNLI